jgi:predicted TIM-barrel fold metal-dependent hydrolase
MEKQPIINCHTHIFTGDNVPPYLAKTFLPFPFYYLLNLNWLVSLFRWWYSLKRKIEYNPFLKRFQISKNKVRIFINKFKLLKTIITWFVTLQVIFILFRYAATIMAPKEGSYLNSFMKLNECLSKKNLLIHQGHKLLEALLILFLIFFLPQGRKFILFIFSKFWKFVGIFSSKQSKALLGRYLNIGRYAFHQKQYTIFSKLKGQYPEGSKFIVLPMDMEFMGAGNTRVKYADQMEALTKIKTKHEDSFFPFVFVDPRRIEKENNYFDFEPQNGKVILNSCFVKKYIEDNKFSGFKIYPALGYYPFDEALLALWKYAADNKVPITTHCIRGTIYYRGKKKYEWNEHPVFEQANGNKNYSKLLLPQMDNEKFSWNFTHPLNYLCLLEEKLLRKLVANGNEKTKRLFGYTNADTPLLYNLNHLKICFGHFGGDDEWLRFFEKDRDNYSSQIVKNPLKGIEFLNDSHGNPSKGKLEIIWKSVDWYTIITSLMLQYENVYADISYILHDETAVLPLLKQTLLHPILKTRVLYGTDFFVVRNHKSDKQMLADMMCGLIETEFDLIARENPIKFLNI